MCVCRLAFYEHLSWHTWEVNEQEETRQQIEILRATLDEEQRFRKQKIEYDSISEKINTFPTRFDLER